MGQNQPRGNQSTPDTKHSKFSKLSFPIKLFQQQAQTMEVDLPCDQTSYKKWKQDLKIYQKLFAEKKYLLLPASLNYENGGMCSQSGTVKKITYPKLPHVLEDEIQSTKAKNNTFSEAEIWKVLNVLVSAKKEYLELGKYFSYDLGNVNPKHIFLNQHNQIKVANPLSWPNYLDGFKSAVLRDPAYLSPEDIKLLGFGALNNDANNHSEEFSIGMTLLSLGLVENLENLYNFDYPTFLMEEFEKKLIFWKTTMYYSEILRSIVLGLLQVDSQDRLTFDEVKEFLKPHVSNIEEGRPLVISNLTPKIQRKVNMLVKELPGLMRLRFEKYSPPKQSESRSARSLPKESKKGSLPKDVKQSKIESIKPVMKVNNQSAEGTQPNVQGTDLMIGRAVQQLFQPTTTTQVSSITRVKSQTRFTYSNRPLQNVSPVKFVVKGQNGTVSQHQILINQQTNRYNPSNKLIQPVSSSTSIQETSIMSSPRVNKITYEPSYQAVRPSRTQQNIVSTQNISSKKSPINPEQNTAKTTEEQKIQQIAHRLISQGLKHADSEVHAQESNRQSTSTEINKLQFLQAGNISPIIETPLEKPIFQQKSQQNYHTYAQILANTDFNSAWDQFLNMIHQPDKYFPELQHKITVSDQIIEIPPGKVKLSMNKEEGKIHLQNVSEKCVGEILGGVSKNSINEVQLWFNSSYSHDGKPFPTREYFTKGLKILKEKLERN